MRQVTVVPHDPELESQQFAGALGNTVVAVHHIGSTAIPGIYTKPIIDLLVEVKNVAAVDRRSSQMRSLGYEAMGEFGIAGRRYFRKDNPAGERTHHVHTFEVGSAQVERYLAFRDYLIAHPEDVQKYSNLKRALVQKHPEDINKYMDGKDGFVKAIDRKAALEYSNSKLGTR